jgi:hypothetical protein
LLARVDVLREPWAPEPREWVFRGHGDARWRLEPSAHRKESWKDFAWPGDAPHDPTTNQSAITQGTEERAALRRLLVALDEAGIAIPSDGQHLTEGLARMHPDANEALPTEMDPFVALARHSGLPTRVLDWTRRAKVACYFAARDAARLLRDAKPTERPTELEVWAFRLRFIEDFGALGEGGAPRLAVVTAPQASNPNLNGQSGVCITQAYGSVAGHLAPFDELVRCIVERLPSKYQPYVPLPLLHRLTLPATEAPKLLRILSYEQITAAHMFPSAEGAVESLREQSLWDRPPATRDNHFEW